MEIEESCKRFPKWEWTAEARTVMADSPARQIFVTTEREKSAGAYQGTGFSRAALSTTNDDALIERKCHQAARCSGGLRRTGAWSSS